MPDPYDDTPPDSIAAAALALVRPVITAATSPIRLLRGYRISLLRGDVLAAVTVALVAVPQSMAFAEVAGLRPEVGLVTMVVAAVVGGLLTSSRYVSLGPTNTMSIMAGSAIAMLAADAQPNKLPFIAAVTILAGLFQIGFALLRLGDMVRYVSHSVMVGFAAGAGVLIALNQLPVVLGVTVPEVPSYLHGLPRSVAELVGAAALPDWRPVLVGGVSLVVVLGCQRISKWLPGYLFAIVTGGLLVSLCGWTPEQLRLVGEVPAALPTPALPAVSWAQYRDLLLPAAAIALVGMIEAYGIGKTLASRDGEIIQTDQEFIAHGLTKVAVGLFQGMPASASFSRSALAARAGANTALACVLGGVFTAGVFVLLAPAAKLIPMASIAAILFVIAYGLIDWRYVLRLIHSNNADLAVCIGTFAATLLIPLEIAVFIGVSLNLALYLRRAKQVYLLELFRDPDSPTGLIERPLHAHQADGAIVFLQLEGNLFFAAADELQERLNQVLRGGAEAVILRLKRTHMVDATVMRVLEQFAGRMRHQGRHVLLCGVRPRMKERMDEFGLTGALGEDHVFTTRDDLFASAKAAIQRARDLTGADLPADPDAAAKRQRPWAYEI